MYRIPVNGKKLERNVPDRSQAAWITYQMHLLGLTQQRIAVAEKVTSTMVRSVIYGRKTSPRIQLAIAHALGFRNWCELVSSERRAA